MDKGQRFRWATDAAGGGLEVGPDCCLAFGGGVLGVLRGRSCPRGGEVVFAVEVDVLVDRGRVGGRERRTEVQRLGDVHDPTQGAPVAETTPMAESMHRYAPKPLCFVGGLNR